VGLGVSAASLPLFLSWLILQILLLFLFSLSQKNCRHNAHVVTDMFDADGVCYTWQLFERRRENVPVGRSMAGTGGSKKGLSSRGGLDGARSGEASPRGDLESSA
jgi:hypothetical protein